MFEVRGRPSDFLKLALLNKSSIDLCLIFLASSPPLLLLLGLWILTGEPLMLTKTLVLLTDLFIGGFKPVRHEGLTEGRALVIFWSFRAERTGDLGVLAGDEGVNRFFGEETILEDDVFPKGPAGLFDGEEEVEVCDLPPSIKPLPLNGMMFRMSCDPETDVQKRHEFSMRQQNCKIMCSTTL